MSRISDTVTEVDHLSAVSRSRGEDHQTHHDSVIVPAWRAVDALLARIICSVIVPAWRAVDALLAHVICSATVTHRGGDFRTARPYVRGTVLGDTFMWPQAGEGYGVEGLARWPPKWRGEVGDALKARSVAP